MVDTDYLLWFINVCKQTYNWGDHRSILVNYSKILNVGISPPNIGCKRKYSINGNIREY
jgi:hypothetical protein